MSTTPDELDDTDYPKEAHELFRPAKALTDFDLPELIEIEPIHTCNLRCIMCHVSYEKLTHAKIDVDLLTKRLKGLEGRWVNVGATHEPVAHPKFPELVLGLSALGMKINLTSNGTLFTPALIDRVAHCNFERVTISFDGIREETYESIRRNSNFSRAIERILNFKHAVTNPSAYFAVNNTIMKRNADEIVDCVAFWEKQGFDGIRFILMVLRDLNESLRMESPEHHLPHIYEQLESAARLVLEENYRITLSSPMFSRSSLREAYPKNLEFSASRYFAPMNSKHCYRIPEN